jgi:D-glycero-alpha-D-manno-heptose-7-phosphate kinase
MNIELPRKFLDTTSSAPTTLRARAPLRLGLAGGGTDLAAYSHRFGGAVLNATIDRYAYAFITPRTDRRVHFSARDLGVEDGPDQTAVLDPTEGLGLHRAVYNRMVADYNDGAPLAVSMLTTVDAPMGSGLGASSALVVAMVEAFRSLLGLSLGPYEVADLAWRIEREDLGLAGGKQDQYAAAFGGVNFIEFHADDRVIVSPLRISNAILNELETSLVTCFSGRSRASDAIIRQQVARVEDSAGPAVEAMHQLKADASEMRRALQLGQIERLAEILNRSWAAKKRTATAIATSEIDALYNLALSRGALGGKVSGAGGGGFMMFVVPPEDRLDLVQALCGAGAEAGYVKLTERGAESWSVQRSMPPGST